jgi:hypothetical protein
MVAVGQGSFIRATERVIWSAEARIELFCRFFIMGTWRDEGQVPGWIRLTDLAQTDGLDYRCKRQAKSGRENPCLTDYCRTKWRIA